MGIYKTAKKYTKKATKAAGKRYGISYGRRGLRMGKGSLDKVVKDVQMIKSRLNVEKKWVQGDVSNGTVGQAENAFAGYYISTLTPLVPLGNGENERNGGSIKMTGLTIQLQMLAQQNRWSSARLKACIVSSTESSPVNVINDLWDPNPLTGFVDYYSNFNYSNQKRAHKVERTVYCYLGRSETLSNSNAVKATKALRINHKFDTITRFEGNDNFPKDMNYFLIIFCDSGNKGPITSGNTGVMQNGDNTGIEIQEYFRWWFVDN